MIECLADDCLSKIFSFVSAPDLLSLMTASRGMRSSLLQHPWAWAALYQRDFGVNHDANDSEQRRRYNPRALPGPQQEEAADDDVEAEHRSVRISSLRYLSMARLTLRTRNLSRRRKGQPPSWMPLNARILRIILDITCFLLPMPCVTLGGTAVIVLILLNAPTLAVASFWSICVAVPLVCVAAYAFIPPAEASSLEYTRGSVYYMQRAACEHSWPWFAHAYLRHGGDFQWTWSYGRVIHNACLAPTEGAALHPMACAAAAVLLTCHAVAVSARCLWPGPPAGATWPLLTAFASMAVLTLCTLLFTSKSRLSSTRLGVLTLCAAYLAHLWLELEATTAIAPNVTLLMLRHAPAYVSSMLPYLLACLGLVLISLRSCTLLRERATRPHQLPAFQVAAEMTHAAVPWAVIFMLLGVCTDRMLVNAVPLLLCCVSLFIIAVVESFALLADSRVQHYDFLYSALPLIEWFKSWQRGEKRPLPLRSRNLLEPAVTHEPATGRRSNRERRRRRARDGDGGGPRPQRRRR